MSNADRLALVRNQSNHTRSDLEKAEATLLISAKRCSIDLRAMNYHHRKNDESVLRRHGIRSGLAGLIDVAKVGRTKNLQPASKRERPPLRRSGGL